MKLRFLFLLTLLMPLAAQAQPQYSVIVDKQAGTWEAKAAQDLATALEQMTGAPVAVNGSAEGRLEFVVGSAAFKTAPDLAKDLARLTSAPSVMRSDAIVVRKRGRQVLLAGSNDDSHYFAVSWFLHKQGCRWYTQGEFGEYIPRRKSLDLEGLDYEYAPPFEVRNIWISWEGDWTGLDEFAHRNFLNQERGIQGKHALGGLLPTANAGEPLVYNDPLTVKTVADNLATKHSQSKNISISMADMVMSLGAKKDRKLAGGFQDKFFDSVAVTDALLPFYNEVCKELWKRNPKSESLVTFLAYTNLTLPPQRAITMAKPLIAFLAPIDIDPNHALEHPSSPERRDYYETLKTWARVMQGRVVIYDYDQSMLVWRDLPNPSHFVVQEDVKTLRQVGVMGFSTESRGATATTFTNLFFRGQLYWNPDLDMEAELALFYKNFYGPAAPAMASYWNAIYDAWENTPELYHEFYIIGSLYTAELVDHLEQQLAKAKALGDGGNSQVKQRLEFTEYSFGVIRAYTQMLDSANQCRFEEAVKQGQRGLKTRAKLKAMNGLFTTGIPKYERDSSWWPGEVKHYTKLLNLGPVLKPTPLKWQLRPDPHDQGIWRNWAGTPWDDALPRVRTDRLLTSQQLFDKEGYLPEGYGWFRCEIELSKAELESGKIHLMFPGLFNTSWFYLNGYLVDWRTQSSLFWRNDYDYDWDIDLSGKLNVGRNILVLRTELKQHPSGMFRRPFLYAPK